MGSQEGTEGRAARARPHGPQGKPRPESVAPATLTSGSQSQVPRLPSLWLVVSGGGWGLSQRATVFERNKCLLEAEHF